MMARILLTFALIFSCQAAFSFDFVGCQVVEVVVADVQNAHVHLNCAVANRPACATDSFFTFDKSTTAGKEYLAMAMSAQALGAYLTGNIVHDEGSCPTWQSNVALLNHLRMTR